MESASTASILIMYYVQLLDTLVLRALAAISIANRRKSESCLRFLNWWLAFVAYTSRQTISPFYFSITMIENPPPSLAFLSHSPKLPFHSQAHLISSTRFPCPAVSAPDSTAPASCTKMYASSFSPPLQSTRAAACHPMASC